MRTGSYLVQIANSNFFSNGEPAPKRTKRSPALEHVIQELKSAKQLLQSDSPTNGLFVDESAVVFPPPPEDSALIPVEFNAVDDAPFVEPFVRLPKTAAQKKPRTQTVTPPA